MRPATAAEPSMMPGRARATASRIASHASPWRSSSRCTSVTDVRSGPSAANPADLPAESGTLVKRTLGDDRAI